jgi:hypothetical protein
MTKKPDRTGNGPGKGKASISSTLCVEVLAAMDYLAKESGLSRGGYISAAVTASVLNGTTFPRVTGTGKIPPSALQKARKAAEKDDRNRPPN